MESPENFLKPDLKGFEADPIGYSALAWHKWGMAQTVAGFSVDISKPPTSDDLKDPVLWLTQAHALSEAAVSIIGRTPNIDHLPIYTKGVCHTQYHAVALMLVGLSLEICLKAMLILREGVQTFTEKESKRRHHKLHKLASFIPNLTVKELAILECLTHFVYWAGKYPDPGSGREKEAVSVFELSEKHEISAKELFALSSKVMSYSSVVIEESSK